MEEQGLFIEIVTRVGEEMKVLLTKAESGGLPAAAVEHQVQGVIREMGRQAAGVLLEAADRALCRERKMHDRRTRTIVTLFGPADVTRGRTADGQYPLDEALGLLGRHAWTGAVQEAASLVACEKGFATADHLLEALLGLHVSAPAVQVMAESAGERAATVLEKPPAATPPSAPGPQTFILAVDGCQAPERDGYHEVKLACGYAHEHRAKAASGRGKLVHKEYLATLEDAQAFGQKLFRMGCIRLSNSRTRRPSHRTQTSWPRYSGGAE